MKLNNFIKLSTEIQNSQAYRKSDLFFCLVLLLLDANRRGKVRTSYRELSIALNINNQRNWRCIVRRLLSRLERAGEITVQTTDKTIEGARKGKELLITIVHFKTYVLL